MRALIWIEAFHPATGGVEVFVERLVSSLTARGVEMTILTNRRHVDVPEVETFDGVPVVRLPFHAAFASGRADRVAALRRRVADLKRRVRPDLVHAHSLTLGGLLHLDTRAAWPAPTLLTVHGIPEPLHGGAGPSTMVQRLFGEAAWICCCSEAVRRAWIAQFGPALLARSSTLYCGVPAPLRTGRSHPVHPPRLLCLGRVVPTKGYDVALEAFALVLADRPDARLVLAGDGRARDGLRERAERLGIAGMVEFPGRVTAARAAALMEEATMVLVPSRREGFGLVAVDAALAERPVVASRIGGLPEAVEDGRTGVLVDPDDPRALARAIRLLLDRPELAESLGRAGRQRAERLFSWDDCVDAYEALYRRTAKESEHGRTRPTMAAQ